MPQLLELGSLLQCLDEENVLHKSEGRQTSQVSTRQAGEAVFVTDSIAAVQRNYRVIVIWVGFQGPSQLHDKLSALLLGLIFRPRTRIIV